MSAHTRSAKLLVRDLTGRLLLEQALQLDQPETWLRLPLLPAGIYTYHLEADGAVRAKRKLLLLRT